MQHRLLLNRNSNFQNWNAGVPLNYTVTPTGGSVIQLDRHWQRSHPERRAFPSHLKAHDLVKDGDFAFRFKDTSGGGDVEVLTDPVAVAPGMNVAIVHSYRFNQDPAGYSLTITFFDDIAMTNTIATVKQPVKPTIYPGVTDKLNQSPGDEAAYQLEPSGTLVQFDASAAWTAEYWRRYGVSVEVPARAHAMDALITWVGTAADGAFDLDDFRFEALDSRVHAGG